MEHGEVVFFAPSSKKNKIDAVECATKDSSKTDTKTDGIENNELLSFDALGIDRWLACALKGLGIHHPTAVQRACVPAVLKGMDALAAAKTGSGKTAAFAVPILHSLSRDPHGFYALVLTPTRYVLGILLYFRELALQIAEQFQILATPGRLADLMSNGQLKMDRLRYLIFDEADRLVAPESSFIKSEIPTILENVGNRRTQWLFFSATMTSAVSAFHRLKRPDAIPFKFDGNSEFGTVETAQQYFMLVPSQVRDSHLVQLLRGPLLSRTVIVFVGKCRTCELVVGMLRQLKVEVIGLHGQMPQKARIASLDKFKSGAMKLLITTDVGSRGLDIPSVEVVVNFDLPADAHDYVHRIGRASRAGRIGSAISFVHELDMDLLKNIEDCIQKKLEPYVSAPTEKEVVQILNEVSAAKRTASMALHDRKFGEKAETNKKKWSR
ncbi:hypothetical protein PSACC_02606 [Paramicrosporidium saccamoebae]|uniref:Uncharacterized protein n=1 Tax=Paramicrosporidium saccamoebae TaxID=1246581 RepID=A0A2H9TIZ3_9FUNG|nr:hypothetical protein PSACC_02606 [Paramicrosporidium saccamoebae]